MAKFKCRCRLYTLGCCSKTARIAELREPKLLVLIRVQKRRKRRRRKREKMYRCVRS